jgi:hypothetical protein
MQRHLLAHRQHGGVAVDAGGRGVDDADVAADARVEQRVGGGEVGAEVGVEAAPRVAHARLGGDVEHPLDALEQLGERGVGDIGLMECEVVVRRQVELLLRTRIRGLERVDADDAMPAPEQLLAQMRPDEPRRPRHHRCRHAAVV